MDYEYKDQHFSVEIAEALLTQATSTHSNIGQIKKYLHKSGALPDAPNDTTGEAYWDKFKAYVEEKGNQLHLFPEPKLSSIYGIQIDGKTLRNEDIFEEGAFWLIAFRSQNELQANFCMQSSTHYKDLKKQEDIIFEGNLGELKWQDDKKWVGFVDDTVGHVSRANTEQEFSWLHERLIKLHKVFSSHVEKWELLQ